MTTQDTNSTYQTNITYNITSTITRTLQHHCPGVMGGISKVGSKNLKLRLVVVIVVILVVVVSFHIPITTTLVCEFDDTPIYIFGVLFLF